MATASKYKSLIFRYAFQSLKLSFHSEIFKITLIIRWIYPFGNFNAVALIKTRINPRQSEKLKEDKKRCITRVV